MKKLFTIAALFIFMTSLTSFTPNEVGGTQGTGRGTSSQGEIYSDVGGTQGTGRGTSSQGEIYSDVGGTQGTGRGTSSQGE